MHLVIGVIMVRTHFLGGEKYEEMWRGAFQLLAWLRDGVTPSGGQGNGK